MAFRTVLLLLSLVGCGLCWKRPINFPGVRDEWPPMPLPGIDDNANQITCDICVVVIGEVQSLLKNESSKITDLLDELCADLPSDYSGTCKEYVDEWTPIIIDFIENQTPEEICQDMTLCDSSEVETPQLTRFGLGHLMRFVRRSFKKNFNQMMIKNALGNNFLCTGCETVVSELHDLLANEQLWDEITALLAEGCAICPVEAQCRAFLKNLPAELKAFADNDLNNQTCKIIGFCPSSRPDDPWDMFSQFFPGFLPDFDADFKPRGPWSRRRPRPDTEPAPRRHPFRPFFERDRPDHGRNRSDTEDHDHKHWPFPRRDRPYHGRNRTDTGDHDHQHWPFPRRDRPYHGRNRSDTEDRDHQYRPHDRDRDHDHDHDHPHGRDHDRPHGRDHPHHRRDRPHRGPHHGYRPDDMPVPDIRPWWKPGMKPLKPVDVRPTLPAEPLNLEDEIPDFHNPINVEVPVNDDILNVEIPDVEIPRVPEVDFRPDPRDPFGFNRQDNRPRPQGTKNWKPHLENRKGASPAKPWSRWGSRKQRSIAIDTWFNTDDFDQTNTFDVEPETENEDEPMQQLVESSWQCDVCEYEVDILQRYMREHEDAINAKLLSLANLFCERLPAASTAECKSEFAELLPPIVDMLIETYMTADTVCSALEIC
ncbi:uncharacterized protein LOC110984484 [Acanthaster planci]|uniref:Uncharacterized protein LOC110984484 n=1 Tax=Acanthaster planci TaxID=133434 RepID=A0A8B7Z6I8_ACAPL|nr:uncharacterized protein LOC110984484 [Acanthaster planci]